MKILGTELTLAPGSGTSDLKSMQAGLHTPEAQPWGSAVCTCLSRGIGWPSHPAEVSESREYKCVSSVMVTVLACGRGQWLPGVVVMRGMCYILHLLSIGQHAGAAEQSVGRWHRWGARLRCGITRWKPCGKVLLTVQTENQYKYQFTCIINPGQVSEQQEAEIPP